MVYEYKWRYMQYPVPAQEAGEYMRELSEKEGGLTARSLLNHSREEDALLHPCFEWDDGKAAEAYRLNQAGDIIRNVVAVAVDNAPVEEVRAFVSTTDYGVPNEGVYKPVIEALADEETKEIVLKNAIREAYAFKKKYKNLNELSGVFDAIDELVQ